MKRMSSPREPTGRISTGTPRQPTPDGYDGYRSVREGAEPRARRDPACGPRAGPDPVLPHPRGRGGARSGDGGGRAGDARLEQLPGLDPRPPRQASGGWSARALRHGADPLPGSVRDDPPSPPAPTLARPGDGGP